MSAVFDDYSLLWIIQRWAEETQEPSGGLAKLLAQAILSKELAYKPAPDESLLIVRDQKGAVLPKVFLPEDQDLKLIGGSQSVQLNHLSKASVRALVRELLKWVVSHPSESLPAMLRIIRLRRSDVADLLRRRGIPLPAFLEPVGPAEGKAQGDASSHSAGHLVKRERPGKHQGRNDQWSAMSEELRRREPGLTKTAIAKRIAADRELNPEAKDSETVRRLLPPHA